MSDKADLRGDGLTATRRLSTLSDRHYKQGLFVGACFGEHSAESVHGAAAADEPKAADRANAVCVQVRQAILERARPGGELVIGPERRHVRGGGHEQLGTGVGELARRLLELDVEADQRTDVEAGQADDLKPVARPEHVRLSAEQPRLPVDARERTVAVDARHGVREAAVVGSLGEPDNDGGGCGCRGGGDRPELGAVGPERRLRHHREVVAAQEELGKDGDFDPRVRGECRDRSLGVCLCLAWHRRQLGEERAHQVRLFGVNGKVALVTGANTGIGLAIATRLLADGFALGYATAGETPELEGPLDELHGQIAWVYGDLTDPKVPEQLVSDVVAKLGRIDVLVNNAGLSTAKPFFDLTAADFDLTFDVDVRASFLLAQAAAKRMRDQGSGGSIVNITSVHEHIPRPNFSIYAASKAALGMLTKGLALELAGHNVRVNSVAPGVVATPRNEADAEKLDPEVPLGRPGKPEEVAALVSFLCSDEASYVTGSSYIIDGGMIQQVVKMPAG